jgi:hypothetical protein
MIGFDDRYDVRALLELEFPNSLDRDDGSDLCTVNVDLDYGFNRSFAHFHNAPLELVSCRQSHADSLLPMYRYRERHLVS